MSQRTATPEDAKLVWDAMARPDASTVCKLLADKGFSVPNVRTIRRWQKAGGWEKPKKKTASPRRPYRTMTASRDRAAGAMEGIAGAVLNKPDASSEDLAAAIVASKDPPPPPEAGKEEEPPLVVGLRELRRRGEEFAKADPEKQLEMCSMAGIQTAYTLFGFLDLIAPYLAQDKPDIVAKAFQAINDGLVNTMQPIDAIIRKRAVDATIIRHQQSNGAMAEILPPEQNDPLAESLKAIIGKHAA